LAVRFGWDNAKVEELFKYVASMRLSGDVDGLETKIIQEWVLELSPEHQSTRWLAIVYFWMLPLVTCRISRARLACICGGGSRISIFTNGGPTMLTKTS